ncbi:hypothetical protein [Cryobacterium glucosi]|uniref:Alpha/beta hydrolase n=1 Tax=Cryobacterium glucosi TaxID=1259175 RepID=A0ABY2II77_9MICO|nr:hypothetical protein [Cryobacterium glucosi]TFC16888.1 hypothetical protein E3O46_17250 [Cryobacterium glucosi]
MFILEPAKTPDGIVVFGPGAGGEPRRYRTLLDSFVGAGFVVIAPTDQRFDPRSVTTEQLQSRVSSLKAALSDYGNDHLQVIAAGHSVGGWAALCLAGGQPWTRDGQLIAVPTEERVSRLVLFAPTLGWFQAPGALARVHTPIIVHAGTRDTVTPAATAELLGAAPAMVNIRVHENVGHFDFMTELPPTVAPTVGLDHDAFLRELAGYASADLGDLTLPS